MKVKPRKVKEKDRIRYLDVLYTAAASLGSREEVKEFLRDLLTESERIMIGRRIIIAQMLLRESSYAEIQKELGVGTDTIMRVHRWLSDQPGGYEKAVKKLEITLSKRLKKYGASPEFGSFEWLKKKYPLHFALFNLFSRKNTNSRTL